jgi:SOS-response transcriptional repressor LexA
MIGLTPKQRQLYDFIAAEIVVKGVAPTIREMMVGVGSRSTGRVAEMLLALEERGCVRRIHSRHRAIELVHPSDRSVTLNREILTLTDRYAQLHGISRDTATNELLRIALGAAA